MLDVIKQDSFGAVYLSEDQHKKTLIIIKKRTKSRAGFDEARLLMKLNVPNIVRILGTSKSQTAFTVVMEHLSGGNLQERLIRPYCSAQFLAVANQICQAMKVAHENKIAHKNLRPSNVLFDAKEQIKLTDFGFDEHYSSDDKTKDWYQAPKHFGSEIVGDIYSVGSIFFHMLTGEALAIEHKKVVPNKLFLKLSQLEQNLIKNMVEKYASERNVSFTAVLKNIEGVRLYKKRLPYVRLAKQLIFYAVVINVALISIAFIKPGLYDLVLKQIGVFMGYVF